MSDNYVYGDKPESAPTITSPSGAPLEHGEARIYQLQRQVADLQSQVAELTRRLNDMESGK